MQDDMTVVLPGTSNIQVDNSLITAKIEDAILKDVIANHNIAEKEFRFVEQEQVYFIDMSKRKFRESVLQVIKSMADENGDITLRVMTKSGIYDLCKLANRDLVFKLKPFLESAFPRTDKENEPVKLYKLFNEDGKMVAKEVVQAEIMAIHLDL